MSNGSTMIDTTLPTIVGMGVVSETTRAVLGRKKSKGRRRKAPAARIVGVSPTRAGAETRATAYRKSLKRRGLPYIGRVKVKKVSGGYATLHRR